MSDGHPTTDTSASSPSSPRDGSLAIKLLLILAMLYTLAFARAIVVPIVLAVLGSVMLTPIVHRLESLRFPTPVASAVVVLIILAGFGFGIYAAGEPVSDWIQQLPDWLRKAENQIRDVQGSMRSLSDATETVEKLADEVTKGKDKAVEVRVKRVSLTSYLLGFTHELSVGFGITIILLYFLLANGDTFLRKLVRVIPRFEDKKHAVEIVRQIKDDVARYFLTITVCNVVLGVAIGVAMRLLNMPNPVILGLMGALLNFIPYIGAVIGACVVGVIALVEFGTPGMAVVVASCYLALTTLEGSVITPTILGRSFELNPVIILVGMMVFTSLWGILGATLTVPMLAAIKITFDRIERLAPIGEFLGK
ncbi:MAG: AI-2E family transporter [Phycisphaerales bacterium]|nr:AI-2E family transporter [Phycisphaerales bacterium]